MWKFRPRHKISNQNTEHSRGIYYIPVLYEAEMDSVGTVLWGIFVFMSIADLVAVDFGVGRYIQAEQALTQIGNDTIA